MREELIWKETAVKVRLKSSIPLWSQSGSGSPHLLFRAKKIQLSQGKDVIKSNIRFGPTKVMCQSLTF